MSKRTAVHDTFVIEHDFAAAPARVFAAFADPVAKARWFIGPKEWGKFEHKLDFRVGGREVNRGGPVDGATHAFNAVYLDIVENERIIYAYDMHIGNKRISASLATIVLEAHALEARGGGTRMVFTEQGVFLDGYDDAGSRRHGTGLLLDQLGATLK